MPGPSDGFSQPVEPAENRWVPVVGDLLRQVYYRLLGSVTIHGPVDEVIPAAAWLATKTDRGGVVYWVVPPGLRRRPVARWDGVTVYPDIRMDVWLFGGPRNTAMLRLGWWQVYVARAVLRPDLPAPPRIAGLEPPLLGRLGR